MDSLAHTFDQLGAHLRDLAPTLASYRDALLANGFTRQEALFLISEYVRIVFTPRIPPAAPPTDQEPGEPS
jgi:hypothetical protein